MALWLNGSFLDFFEKHKDMFWSKIIILNYSKQYLLTDSYTLAYGWLKFKKAQPLG